MKAIQLSILLKDKTITRIYTGPEHGCRCGCHGTYWYPGNKGFARALNKAKDLDPIVDLYAWDESALDAAISEQTKNEHDGVVRACAQSGPGKNSESCMDRHLHWQRQDHHDLLRVKRAKRKIGVSII